MILLDDAKPPMAISGMHHWPGVTRLGGSRALLDPVAPEPAPILPGQEPPLNLVCRGWITQQAKHRRVSRQYQQRV